MKGSPSASVHSYTRAPVRGLQLSSNRHKRYRADQKAHAAATVEDLQHRISELEIQLQQARETQRNFPERAHPEEKVSRLGEDLAQARSQGTLMV